MKIFGVIIEANPFHNGHQYLINKIKADYSPELTIAVCSGYFSMRGEISVLPKLEKTEILLKSGFDLIIDLPLYSSLNSSLKFGENSIYLLNQAKITDLVFGIEEGSKEDLEKILEIEKNSLFKETLISNLNTEYSYKKAYSKTILNLSHDQRLYQLSLLPNITLALDYIRIIHTKYPHIQIHTIQRIGNNDNSIELTSIPSGSALREAIKNHIPIDQYINYNSDKLINLTTSNQILTSLLHSLIITNNDHFKNIHLVSEGIENYILNNIDVNIDYEQNINKLANKKYTKSRIKRTIISMLLNLEGNITEDLPLRVLGFSKKGENHFKNLRNVNLCNNIKTIDSKYFDYELKASKLYNIITKSNSYKNEFKFPIKEN
ncbi:MAG: nucleotidyltransferase family protein [Bacilli bacterium]|nr:nucleotidyltransferase family protein [Bacilli bacterium]